MLAIANKENENFVVCCKCRHVYVKPKVDTTEGTICPSCSHDPDHHDVGCDPYFRSKSCHPEKPPSVKVAEPCIVNPNTKVNIKQVLHHVQNHTDVGANKERQ